MIDTIAIAISIAMYCCCYYGCYHDVIVAIVDVRTMIVIRRKLVPWSFLLVITSIYICVYIYVCMHAIYTYTYIYIYTYDV